MELLVKIRLLVFIVTAPIVHIYGKTIQLQFRKDSPQITPVYKVC